MTQEMWEAVMTMLKIGILCQWKHEIYKFMDDSTQDRQYLG